MPDIVASISIPVFQERKSGPTEIITKSNEETPFLSVMSRDWFGCLSVLWFGSCLFAPKLFNSKLFSKSYSKTKQSQKQVLKSEMKSLINFKVARLSTKLSERK